MAYRRAFVLNRFVRFRILLFLLSYYKQDATKATRFNSGAKSVCYAFAKMNMTNDSPHHSFGIIQLTKEQPLYSNSSNKDIVETLTQLEPKPYQLIAIVPKSVAKQ